MNYGQAIKELEEKRDYYAAAIAALKKIRNAEGWAELNETPAPKKKSRSSKRVWTPEQRAQHALNMKAAWAKRHQVAVDSNGIEPAPVASADAIEPATVQ